MSVGYEFILDISVLITVLSAILLGIKALYDMKREQERIKSVLYGDDDDKTRPGVLIRQHDTEQDLEKQIIALEKQMDEQFDILEDHLHFRHNEIAIALRKIMVNMEDPPEDLNIRGPYDDSDKLDK